uniref:Uncharacterized protein n=1 Tax=Sphaerodactylus townsendi TaxID=933632 RepID=A0ACB8FT53_9SAUR
MDYQDSMNAWRGGEPAASYGGKRRDQGSRLEQVAPPEQFPERKCFFFFCDGVVEDEILCEQGEEKGLTLAASPPEEQQEGMCETALPEGSPEQSADALSELPLPNCSELEGEGNVTEGLTSLPDSDLKQEPEVSEKPITAGYLEMQVGLLKESVDFPQGDTTVITQPVKAVYIDVADPITAKSSSISFQVKGDEEEVLLNANFEDEIVWFDMQSAKGITPEQQAQVAEILAEGKGMFCSKPGYTDLISHYIDMGGNLPIEVMSYTMMLHHAVTRKRNSKGRDTIVFSPEKKVSDYG